MDKEEAFRQQKLVTIQLPTMRQFYAAMAMQGILSGCPVENYGVDYLAKDAFKVADAMIDYEFPKNIGVPENTGVPKNTDPLADPLLDVSDDLPF